MTQSLTLPDGQVLEVGMEVAHMLTPWRRRGTVTRFELCDGYERIWFSGHGGTSYFLSDQVTPYIAHPALTGAELSYLGSEL